MTPGLTGSAAAELSGCGWYLSELNTLKTACTNNLGQANTANQPDYAAKLTALKASVEAHIASFTELQQALIDANNSQP